MKSKTYQLFAIALLLTGCSTLETVADKGADANDALLDGAEQATSCIGSVGAVKRKYGGRQGDWDAYCQYTTCGSRGDFSPVGE